MNTPRIRGAASHFPDHIVTNHDLEKMVDTSDEWIRERTGIGSRRKVAEGEAASDLAAVACRKVLQQVDVKAEDIDLLIIGTISPDMFFPSTACIVQEKLGATNAWGFDLSAACSGFVYGFSVAEQYLRTGKYQRALVVGVDVMSSVLDYTDRSTCVIFGDGAAVVYMEASESDTVDGKTVGVIDTIMKADGSGAEFLYMPGGGSRQPATAESLAAGKHFLKQDGRAVFKTAVKRMAAVSEEILQRNDLTPADLNYYVAHQANIRIIEAAAKRLELRPEQMITNIEEFGNTTAATIPSCLAQGVEQGKINTGDLILIATFGAGFTWGSALFRWG